MMLVKLSSFFTSIRLTIGWNKAMDPGPKKHGTFCSSGK